MVRTLPRRRLVLPAVAVAALAVGSLTARTGVEAWTTQYVGVSHGVSSANGSRPAAVDIGRSVALGPDGSIYVAGFHESGSITLGTHTITTTNGSQGFVAKFDTNGDPTWLTTYPSSADAAIGDIAVSPAGDLYIAGSFRGTMTFATTPTSTTLTSAGDYDGFVARLDSSGSPIWAVSIGGTGADELPDLVYGPGATITAVGTIVGATGGSSTIASTSPWNDTANSDGVIVNLSTTGTLNWTTRIGGTGVDDLRNVAAHTDGSIAVIGLATTTSAVQIAAPGGSHTTSGAHGGRDVVIARLTGTGNATAVAWSQIVGGAGNDVGEGVTFDSVGRVTVAIQGGAPFTVGGTAHTGGVALDTIISQFAADGTPRWTRVIDSGFAADGARDITLAPDDNVVTTGRYGTATQPVIFAVAHDPDGDVTWGPIQLGDGTLSSGGIGQGVAVSTSGDVYLTGRFAGGPVDPTDPTRTLTVNGGSDIVLFGFAVQLPASTTTAPSTTAAPTTTDATTTGTAAPAATTSVPDPTTTDATTTTTPVTTTTEVLFLPITGGDTTASTVLLLLAASGALLMLIARRRA